MAALRRGSTSVATPKQVIEDVPVIFGNEAMEPIMMKLTARQLATLVKYPEEALSVDLVQLIFFNKEFPTNHNIRFSNGEILAYTTKGWRAPSKGALDVLHVVATHYRKLVEYTNAQHSSLVFRLDCMRANEYLRAISIETDINVSTNCPFYSLIDSGIISVERMRSNLSKTVTSACMWPKDEWADTIQYAKENIFDDDVDTEL